MGCPVPALKPLQWPHVVRVRELWLGYRKEVLAEAGLLPRFPGTPGTSSPLRLPQILPPCPATRTRAPTSFLASAPLCILLGYREMTEAAFLRNSAGQRPNGLGPGTGARGEGSGTCTHCTCGWPGSRCARSWPVLQENRSENSPAAALPTHRTDRAHTPTGEEVGDALVGALLGSFALAHGRHRHGAPAGAAGCARTEALPAVASRRVRSRCAGGAAAVGGDRPVVAVLPDISLPCPWPSSRLDAIVVIFAQVANYHGFQVTSPGCRMSVLTDPAHSHASSRAQHAVICLTYLRFLASLL